MPSLTFVAGLWTALSAQAFFSPSPGGGGSAHMSEAKCETGWGDLSARALFSEERASPHLAANFIRGDPPPPGEGESCIAYATLGSLTRPGDRARPWNSAWP